MKKKVISMLLAVSMISTSPIYATEFSDGNSVVVNDADAVNGTDADSADSAEIPDTSLFSSDAVDGAVECKRIKNKKPSTNSEKSYRRRLF